MKVLIIGSGGREYGMAWAAKNSPLVEEVLMAPGNAGMTKFGRCFPIGADDDQGLMALAQKEGVQLVLVGPEGPLVAGLVDKLQAAGIAVFGPVQMAAQLEGSKAYAKAFMQKYNIPTAAYEVFTETEAALQALDRFGLPVVIKADGLAAGKGVFVAMTREEAVGAITSILVDKSFGDAGQRVVVEAYMEGEEASILAFSDGKVVVPLIASQDHKRIGNGDQGPNTGGMGAYSPAPVITAQLMDEIKTTILNPVITGMQQEGHPYQGILYAGLMMTAAGPKVVEFNCRFGDPETQVILPLLTCDLIEIALACTQGRLQPEMVTWKDEAAVTVVLASPGYPGPYPKGLEITGVEQAEALDKVMVWHAGTAFENGHLVTNGGRVLNVIATGEDIKTAVARVYQACVRIRFDGMQYRTDIGHRALARLR